MTTSNLLRYHVDEEDAKRVTTAFYVAQKDFQILTGGSWIAHEKLKSLEVMGSLVFLHSKTKQKRELYEAKCGIVRKNFKNVELIKHFSLYVQFVFSENNHG